MYNNALVSFAAQTNVRSIRVMKKIGLKRDVNGNFTHPKLSAALYHNIFSSYPDPTIF